MTQIVYEKNPSCTELTVMGHCNAGRVNGMDLCCCAVSMLVFTILETLARYSLKGYRYSYGGGWCHIKFLNKGKDYKKAGYATEAIMNGFGLLEKRYPSSVKVVIKEGVTENV
ncbi:MAG: ribosomal-processing cysteine protease Prp [Clostridia bacterium]|nr:ribosomal-processing cysteine protease Prp [Clostridia bacterium]